MLVYNLKMNKIQHVDDTELLINCAWTASLVWSFTLHSFRGTAALACQIQFIYFV